MSEIYGPFRIFRYITFRAAAAALTALIISFVLGPRLIRHLKSIQFGQQIRDDGPQTHLKKQGTPTMGGILIIIAITIPVLLWCNLESVKIWLVLFVLIGLGGLGFADDYIKILKGRSLGVRAKLKLVVQVTIGFIIGYFVYFMAASGNYGFSTELPIPFLKDLLPDLGIVYIFLVVLILTGVSNAVNLTDGLDGLAIGLFTISIGTLAIFGYCAGHSGIADYLQIMKVSGAGELTIVCSAMTGAGLGFLWFNGHPAQIFMGDTGALSLGGALGMISILVKQEILLLLLGGIFVAETLSVVMQVAYFKSTGRRIFLMAPLHHHFEEMGWPESKVIIRFWIIGIILAVLSLATLKIR